MVNLILQRLRTAELGEGGEPSLTVLRPVVKRQSRWLAPTAQLTVLRPVVKRLRRWLTSCARGKLKHMQSFYMQSLEGEQ